MSRVLLLGKKKLKNFFFCLNFNTIQISWESIAAKFVMQHWLEQGLFECLWYAVQLEIIIQFNVSVYVCEKKDCLVFFPWIIYLFVKWKEMTGDWIAFVIGNFSLIEWTDWNIWNVLRIGCSSCGFWFAFKIYFVGIFQLSARASF